MHPKSLVFLFAILYNPCLSQLQIDTSRSINFLVREVLMSKNSNLIISNIKYVGANTSIGLFKSEMLYNDFITQGIVISTGSVFDAIGPNNMPNQSSESFASNDYDLSGLGNGDSFDAAILSFDFITTGDSVTFNFFFASEEYPEFVNKNVNDVFGFYLMNEALGVHENLAQLPFLEAPVSIDNINATTNSQYFVENGIWDDTGAKKWINNRKLGELAYTFQFDGLTTMIHVASKVVPNQKYHLKMAIADIGDRNYDSAIFLAGGSLQSPKSISSVNLLSVKQLVEDEFNDEVITDLDTAISISLNIAFEFNSYQVSAQGSYELLDKIFSILQKEPLLSLEIYGHTDNVGTKDYNKILSVNRAKFVSTYLLRKGVKDDRIMFYGLGDTKPLSELNNSLNRRVEFVFKKNR